jgi:ubiquinone biosynthesis protein UbiJ
LFFVIALESPFAAALNHLLRSEPWARERLAPFAGAGLELRSPPLPALRFVIAVEGSLAPARENEAPPALTVTLTPAVLPALLRGEDHLVRALKVDGDPKLADAVLYLARHLRWDAEEDLSLWLGDAAAHRIARGARGFAASQVDAGRRALESLMEYVTEEQPLLVRRGEADELGRRAARLRDALDRLEQRLERLAG